MIGTSGDITFAGNRITGMSPQQVARLGIAHVPQGRGTFSDLSVQDNLRVGKVNRRDGEIQRDLERWYSVFPCPASAATRRPA